MKKLFGLLLFVIGITWMTILFFGFVIGLKKTFREPPRDNDRSATKLLEEQRHRSADLAEQQKRLMEDRKARLRDMQRR